MDEQARRPKRTAARSRSSNDPSFSIRIDGRNYAVLEQLSLPGRGRWLVRDPQPHPRGTLCTAIVLEPTPESKQLERSLWRLPESSNSLPQLNACGFYQGKRVWIVSWQKGTSLERYLQNAVEGRWQRPSVSESVWRIKSLSHSLRNLWQYCQIVHADVKPANLILPSNAGSIFLTDFGSSWQVERTSSRVKGDGSHPVYTAPELLLPDRQIDFRADQFSTGVVLYEMLTLERPYLGIGGKAGLPDYRAEMESEYEPPSSKIDPKTYIPKSILTELDRVVGQLLQLDPENRFATPQHFCNAMDRLVQLIKNAEIIPAADRSDELSNRETELPRNTNPVADKIRSFLFQMLGGD